MSDTAPIVYTMLGGCTTRDAAELGSRPLPRPARYFSRSRLQSIVSTPSPIDAAAIDLKSGFQRRVVVQDHDKTIARKLSKLDHPLLMDLVGERSVLKRTEHGIITDSNYYRKAGLSRLDGAAAVPEDHELAADGPFAVAARAFAGLLPPRIPVVVHRSFWALTDTGGASLAERPDAERSNAWLERAYGVLETALGERAGPVEVRPELRVADPGHRWGPAPFHFRVEYYEELADLVRERLAAREP